MLPIRAGVAVSQPGAAARALELSICKNGCRHRAGRRARMAAGYPGSEKIGDCSHPRKKSLNTPRYNLLEKKKTADFYVDLSRSAELDETGLLVT